MWYIFRVSFIKEQVSFEGVWVGFQPKVFLPVLFFPPLLFVVLYILLFSILIILIYKTWSFPEHKYKYSWGDWHELLSHTHFHDKQVRACEWRKWDVGKRMLKSVVEHKVPWKDDSSKLCLKLVPSLFYIILLSV